VSELETAIREHCALFNACVVSGDWGAFVATFAEDARMVTAVAPDRPLTGRGLIARLYAKYPPTETMAMDDVEVVGEDTARARFRWAGGGAGAMTVRWTDGQVADVVLTGDVP
jgi:hypothetical protein